jgi:phenylalanyl-tRNA synthetase beta chain
MKLSIAWLFDHIDAQYTHLDMSQLMSTFNQKVAEIEGFYTSKIDLASLFLAQVESVAPTECFIPELNESTQLPSREGIEKGQWYLIIKKRDGYDWANQSDLGRRGDEAEKMLRLLPAMSTDEQDAKGGWKQQVVAEDYIIEIDNKSITHRPDMWGHRGFAREIALLLGKTMKPLDNMITTLPIQDFSTEVPATAQQPFSARIIEPRLINRFAYAYFSEIHNESSLPWMAARLCRIGQRPIDALVDMTNYVMCDMGQPMHAFDANGISAKHFEIRLAKPHEKLTLLDDETIELTDKDIVITDGTKPISLAGVMGGKDTQMQPSTASMVLESAHFDATSVRETAARHKKRTEASARFEKTLDPNQNILAIERFVRLLQDAEILYKVSGIASMGPKAQELAVSIEHEYIEKRLGVEIAAEQIISVLHSLGFQATTATVQGNFVYHIQVPTFRSTKDVRIKEDILEEIGRSFGYTNIPFVLPHKEMKPSSLHHVYVVRRIKQLLAYGCAMREVSNYSFYDEDFLRELHWQPQDSICVQSPVSENWKALTGSLIPGLLKNICQNNAEYDRLSFFEWGRVWHKDQDQIIERKQLAGIKYSQKNSISFYDLQALIEQIAHLIRLPLSWQKVCDPTDPWFAPYQTARIMYGDICIGTVGVIDIAFTHSIFSGYAAAFVLDGDFLVDFYGTPIRFVASSKYPSVQRDISIMVPLAVTVDRLQEAIYQSSDLIKKVTLVDMFRKEDWVDTKSLTFNFIMQDEHKTLTSQEVDAIAAGAIQAVQALGAQVR